MRFTVVVREPGTTKHDYSLDFDAPMLPRKGDYLSVQRPDKPRPFGEDMIVREVWWRLDHPEVLGMTSQPKVGSVHEIFVECEPALSPYSSEDWKRVLGPGLSPKLDVDRFAVPEEVLREMQSKQQ